MVSIKLNGIHLIKSTIRIYSSHKITGCVETLKHLFPQKITFTKIHSQLHSNNANESLLRLVLANDS